METRVKEVVVVVGGRCGGEGRIVERKRKGNDLVVQTGKWKSWINGF